MRLEKIKLSEINTLQKLAIDTYEASFGHKNKPGITEQYYEYAFAKAQLSQQLSNSQSFWYFVYIEEQIIGYIKYNILNAQTEFQEVDGIELERIYLINSHQNKGYGKRLIEFMIEKARTLKKKYIWLGVWEENPKAIQFYQQCGFKITGTHNYDMIAEIQMDYIMRLDL